MSEARLRLTSCPGKVRGQSRSASVGGIGHVGCLRWGMVVVRRRGVERNVRVI